MKDFKIYIIIACILLGLYLVAEYNKPNPTNWSPTLFYGDKIPFGTYVLYHQLGDLFPEAKVTKTDSPFYDIFRKLDDSSATYLVFAKLAKVDKPGYDELIKYIKKGNSVFISSFRFTGVLADTLNLDIGFELQKESAGLNFTSKYLKQDTPYRFKRQISNQYFRSFDTARATVLGANTQGHSTFLRFKFGAGYLYLCANPAMFSNYAILSGGAGYAEKALSYLPKNSSNIYWDEYQNGDIPIDESPMRVLFTSPSLEWAYYISLLGLIVFVLYEVKRRQRIIPIVEPPKNSTVEFVNVVGQVYFEQRNNTDIAKKKVTYLLEHLREDYQLKTNKLDAEFTAQLSQKLSIAPAFAAEIVSFILHVESGVTISDHDLIKLNNLIEKLYTQIA
jgi:hypothetical protein